MKRITGTVLRTGALAVALALTACGGGGDSAANGQREVQGTAAKGLIKGALVSVYEIDAQGVRASTALTTTTTGADGTYKLQVPASVLNFVIEVSAAPGAVMADEATGTDIALPADMKLRSVVTLADNAGLIYEGSVSPLTEMVARTAERDGGKLTRQAVAEAKTNVRTLLGFDPEKVKPVNSNSDAAAGANEDEQTQSLALAAISKMAATSSTDCPQSGAGERIACVVTQMAGSVTIKDGKASLEQTRLTRFRDAIDTVTKDKTINRTGKENVVGLPVLKGETPAAGPALPPLEATKALFTSLRNNMRSIGEGDALSTTAKAIKEDLIGSVQPLGNDIGGFASLTVSAIDYLNRYRADAALPVRPVVRGNQVYATAAADVEAGIWSGDGSCEITASPLSISCNVVQTPQLPGSASTATGNTTVYVARTITLQPKAGSTSDFSYTALKEKTVANYTYQTPAGCTGSGCASQRVILGTPTREALGGAFAGDITFARTGNTLTQVAVKGRMPGMTDSNGALVSDFEDWSLDFTRTEEANSVVLFKFGGAFTAMKAGQAAGTLEIDNASFLRVAMQGTDDKVAPNAANELQLTLRGILGGTTISGTLRASEGKQDKSKTTHVPTRMSFEGSLKHKDGSLFSGNVAIIRNGYENFDATAAGSDTNFVADTVEIGGALSVPNRPKLSLTVGATRTGLDAGNVRAQYSDGTSVINASMTGKVGDRHPLVKVSSTDGVAFEFTSTSSPVPVTKDGATVGELNLTKGIITYSDGSTESVI
jgi:hypothetical protein